MTARRLSSRRDRLRRAAALLAATLLAGTALAAGAKDLAALPANQWVLLDEVKGRGKRFAPLIAAGSVGRLYLWGFGGRMTDRATFERYELESFDPAEGKWADALPEPRRDAWADGKWPAFRIHGQMGTDGPRFRAVGSMQPNEVTFFTTDGVARPSPVSAFNQACWDSRRGRALFYTGGRTFALDPRTHTWSDLQPAAAPTACATLAWASLCYDPARDRAVLFGGGLAANLTGGADTWIYDCRANAWRRAPLAAQPPLRCNAPIVYDPKADAMVLFGGDNQAAALNDTWVYHCRDDRWRQRRPTPSPPPMFTPAAATVPGGGFVVVCGANALASRKTHGSRYDFKETWVYDVAADRWQPIAPDLDLSGYHWLTAAPGAAPGVVFLVACQHNSPGKDIRRTYALRFDPAGAIARRPGAPPGTMGYKHAEQKDSLEAAEPRDADDAEKFFHDLPANSVVDANAPGLLVSKTWSSAIFDTDRGEVIYTGGGHSGYSGNDFAHYHPGENRWSLSWPPQFPPFLESTNSSVFGWSYGPRPWSQHSYRWYAYDPLSKRVIYCARPAGPYTGHQVLLDDDPNKAFVHDSDKQGHFCWLYDPERRTLARPSLGRPFEQSWYLALASTPRGVYARAMDGRVPNRPARLFHAIVERDAVRWELVDESPQAPSGYSYEWQPLVYDSKRDRLVVVMGKGEQVEVHARPFAGSGWQRLQTTGPTEISREVVYAPKADALVSLGKARLHVLDLATNRWRQLDTKMPKGLYGTECAMVHDPKRDVCILLIPSRFSGPMKVYFLRYDPGTAKYATE